MLSHALLILLLMPLAVNAASGAVQPPPACQLPTGVLGTSANGKWICQPPAAVLQGPPGNNGTNGTNGTNGLNGQPGVNGGPLPSQTYTAGMTVAPVNGQWPWYAIYGTTNIAIPLPAAGVAPWTNPALACFTNYGDRVSAAGQVTFTAPTGTPLYGGPAFLGFNQTVCFGIDDQTPPGWRGDGGN